MDKALELADEFKEENNDWNEDNLRHWGKQTEAMLRQQQEKIKDLQQQVEFLEDWRATWAPTIKQIMGIDGKCGEE